MHLAPQMQWMNASCLPRRRVAAARMRGFHPPIISSSHLLDSRTPASVGDVAASPRLPTTQLTGRR